MEWREEGPDRGTDLHRWISDLFPICRSLTGNGVRRSLSYLANLLPELSVHEVPSGTAAFDWQVPDEWNIEEGYIESLTGERIVDFRNNNLHVVGYSIPIDVELSLQDLDSHLHSLPGLPDAIPYVTSYYVRRWGFCLPHRLRSSLPNQRYRAVIRSSLAPGSMTLADLVIPGEEPDEVFISSNICHPSLANNELSGPVVAIALARWILRQPRRRLTYRFVFVPETIGALAYLAENLSVLQERVIAGFVLTCIGDEAEFSLLRSRTSDTLADRSALHVLGHYAPGFRQFDYLTRGSDERQYGSPLAALPVASIMRSHYDHYMQYHTSLDDLTFVTPSALDRSLRLLKTLMCVLDANITLKATTVGEPQLGRRGLYPTIGGKNVPSNVRDLINFLAYADGTRDMIAIADRIGLKADECIRLAQTLIAEKLVVRI